jgi:membrane dipeptidase
MNDDSETRRKNLTEWGENVILEMNRLGMIVDISHVSEGVMVDVLETTMAPVIFSHSSAYTIRPHTRNVKDHVLHKLRKNNGVIMINFYSDYVSERENATIFDVIGESAVNFAGCRC